MECNVSELMTCKCGHEQTMDYHVDTVCDMCHLTGCWTKEIIVECEECEGNGYIDTYCLACNGSGEGMHEGTRCRSCNGSGSDTEECSLCDGTGRMMQEDEDE